MVILFVGSSIVNTVVIVQRVMLGIGVQAASERGLADFINIGRISDITETPMYEKFLVFVLGRLRYTLEL